MIIESTPEILALLDTCSELQDSRFAVIAEHHFEMVSYNACADSNHYNTVTVYDAEGCYNLSCASQESHASVIVEQTIYLNDAVSAQAHFVRLITERLTRFE
jgi:hypothetical protein